MQQSDIEFFQATAQGHAGRMVELLNSGRIDVEKRDPEHMTPLLVALTCGQLSSMSLLLGPLCNANVNVRDRNGNNALHFICSSRSAQKNLVLRQFLRYLDVRRSAAEKQQAEQRANNNNNNNNNNDGVTANAAAPLAAVVDDKQVLLDSCESHGLTPLHVAAKSGSFFICEVLLANGASASIDKPCQCPDTPLTAAVRLGDTSVAQLLLDNGANVEFASLRDGATPLAIAIRNCDTDMIKLLLSSGAKTTGWACKTAPGCCRSYEHLCEKINRKDFWELIATWQPDKKKRKMMNKKGATSDAEDKNADDGTSTTERAKRDWKVILATALVQADWAFWTACIVVAFAFCLMMK